MHDIDRTLMEYESGTNGYEGEHEAEFGDEYEYEFEGEYEAYEEPEVFDEEEEMDLAAELLSVTDDEELEQFLGSLVKKVGRKARKFVKSGTGRALGGLLKGVAKKALPIIGGAAGTALGGPVGGAIGGKLAATASRLFEMELEGLSPEDQEFEVAKRVVRLAGSAAKKAALAPSNMPPKAAAKAAVIAAAKRYAPGLLREVASPTDSPATSIADTSGAGRSGRWVRRGSKIILMGV
jgi:uncharacterized protein (DUF697 family)